MSNGLHYDVIKRLSHHNTVIPHYDTNSVVIKNYICSMDAEAGVSAKQNSN